MTNPLKTEHAIDWRKTAQEIEDQFQAGMIERDRYRAALEKLARLGNEPHYGNSDGNRIAQEALGVEVGVDA